MNHRGVRRVALAVPDPAASRPERLLLLSGLAATLALLFTSVWWLGARGALGLGVLELGFVGGFVLAALILACAVVRDRVGLRVGVAALMALAPGAYVLAELCGVGPAYPGWSSSARVEVLTALVCTVGAVGLVARKSWARWLALAAALAGIGTGGLNYLGVLFGRFGGPTIQAWCFVLAIVFSALVGLALVGPSVRGQFESRGADGIWSSREPAVRAIRWSVLAQLVAIPMLLVYAWSQPIVAQTQMPAVVLAAVLAGAALLSMARKLAGAALLVLGGPGLLVLAAVSAWHAHAMGAQELSIIGYYACFWVPAGLISTVAGFVLARPVVELWRQL